MTITVSANNGQAPASALAAMPGNNGDGSRQTSPTAVVASYARIRAGMQAAGLGDLLPSSGWSCYRDRAAQQHMRDIGLTTIPVGQSIHGEWSLGGAVDFANLGGFGAPRHNWMRNNTGSHGWYQPGWAQAGGSLPEPWHWEYDSRRDQHTGDVTPPTEPVQEDDAMFVLQAPDRGLAVVMGDIVVPIGETNTADALTAQGVGRAAISNADFDRLRMTGTTQIMIREPSRGYALLTGSQAIGIGDMATVYALQGVGTTTIDVPAGDFDRMTGGISNAIPAGPVGATYGVNSLIALVIAVALLVGVGVVLVTDVVPDGAYAGGGTLLGGVIGLLAYALGSHRRGRHDAAHRRDESA